MILRRCRQDYLSFWFFHLHIRTEIACPFAFVSTFILWQHNENFSQHFAYSHVAAGWSLICKRVIWYVRSTPRCGIRCKFSYAFPLAFPRLASTGTETGTWTVTGARQRLLDTSHGSHTWIFIGIVNKIFTHMRILLLHSAKIITKKGGEREIKAEDLRGQGCVCICPENRVGVWEFWGIVLWAFPAVVYHVDLQLKCCQCPRITPCYGTQVDRVQFICGYNLIFNIHNSRCRCRCHLPALATCPARQQLKHCQMLLKCQKIRIHE